MSERERSFCIFIYRSFLSWGFTFSIYWRSSNRALLISSRRISHDLWSLNYTKECIIGHLKTRILSHESKLVCSNFVLIKSSLERVQFCHLLKSDQVIESAVAFDINSHGNTKVTTGVYLGYWDASILTILTF